MPPNEDVASDSQSSRDAFYSDRGTDVGDRATRSIWSTPPPDGRKTSLPVVLAALEGGGGWWKSAARGTLALCFQSAKSLTQSNVTLKNSKRTNGYNAKN